MRWGNECEFYALTSPKDMAILIIMQVPQSNEEVFLYERRILFTEVLAMYYQFIIYVIHIYFIYHFANF